MTNYDDQFNLRRRHPLGRVHLFINELQSYIARLTLKKSLDVSYGNGFGEKVDIFPAPHSNAPVFVFIHGGYFRSLDKRQYSYIAKPFVDSGCTVALINYDLAPAVTVEQIIHQNIRAFMWIYENITRWNGNAGNIVMCGHSVGAFLVAKILEFNWRQEVRQSISGAVLLSGLYDLTKMKHSYLNTSLKLSDEDVTTLSPIFADISDFPHSIIAVGEDETEEFIEQSRKYSSKLADSKKSHEYLFLEDKNHYSVSRLLSNKNNQLMKRILSMCGVNLVIKNA